MVANFLNNLVFVVSAATFATDRYSTGKTGGYQSGSRAEVADRLLYTQRVSIVAILPIILANDEGPPPMCPVHPIVHSPPIRLRNDEGDPPMCLRNEDVPYPIRPFYHPTLVSDSVR